MIRPRHQDFELDPSTTQLIKRELVTDLEVAIALAALLTYDAVLMLDKEVKHFWKQPKQITTWLYFMSRYAGLISLLCGISIYSTNVNDASCLAFENMEGVFELMTILSVDYILLLRVQALYLRSKIISIVVNIMFAIETLVGIALFIQGNVVAKTESATVAPGFSLCFNNSGPDPVISPISWSIPLAYNFFLMMIALYKARIVWKEAGCFKGMNLVYILIRDQAVYFVAVMFCSIMHIAGVEISNVFLSYVVQLVGAPALLCVLGPRLLINMREASDKGVNFGSSFWTTMSSTISDIEFDELVR